VFSENNCHNFKKIEKHLPHFHHSELAFFQLVFIVFRQALKTQCNLMLNPSCELEPNRKLVHHHLPSIFHGALSGAGSFWPWIWHHKNKSAFVTRNEGVETWWLAIVWQKGVVTLELLEDSRRPEFMLGVVVFVYLCCVGWHWCFWWKLVMRWWVWK